MPNAADTVLRGAACSCAVAGDALTIDGSYYRYDNYRRVNASGPVTVKLADVLRVGITKTYSRRIFAVPMTLGGLALLVRAIPSVGKSIDIIPGIWSIDLFTLWSFPHQEAIWHFLAVTCLLTIPLYWLSYRNDLEINTMQGRYLLPRKGMEAAQIAAFQREFTRLKEARQKARKGA